VRGVGAPDKPDGLTQWEITIAELLSAQGYTTGMWGKWHLGSTRGAIPTHQGFDEWYGIPRSYTESMWPYSNETNSLWPSVGARQGWNAKVVSPEPIFEARKGEKARKVAELDVARRRNMDAEITTRAVDFIKRNATAGKPFFAYVAFSLVHMPTLPNPEFAGKTATAIGPIVSPKWTIALARSWTRSRKRALKTTRLSSLPAIMAQRRRTLGKVTAGRGVARISPRWKLHFVAPFMIRWPGKVPASTINNEIVHVVDLYTTLARVCGADVPKDRPIDGVDQLDFFLGKQENSNREGFPAYVSDRLSAVKWRNWKMHLFWQENMYDPPQKLPLPKIINLVTDLKEQRDVNMANSWVRQPMEKIISEFQLACRNTLQSSLAHRTHTYPQNRQSAPTI
jgi:arylsulfatase